MYNLCQKQMVSTALFTCGDYLLHVLLILHCMASLLYYYAWDFIIITIEAPSPPEWPRRLPRPFVLCLTNNHNGSKIYTNIEKNLETELLYQEGLFRLPRSSFLFPALSIGPFAQPFFLTMIFASYGNNLSGYTLFNFSHFS